jgi:hypothetical protein
MRMRIVTALVVALVCACAGSAGALDEKPVPAFDLVSPAGAVVASTDLSKEAHWLLVYVAATGCGSCDRLLAALEQWRPTLPQGRIVVVIRGEREAAHAYATRHAVANEAWYADAGQSGARALGFEHVPALVAVEHGRIAWIVTGVLNDPAAVEPIVRSWTAR